MFWIWVRTLPENGLACLLQPTGQPNQTGCYGSFPAICRQRALSIICTVEIHLICSTKRTGEASRARGSFPMVLSFAHTWHMVARFAGAHLIPIIYCVKLKHLKAIFHFPPYLLHFLQSSLRPRFCFLRIVIRSKRKKKQTSLIGEQKSTPPFPVFFSP